MQLKSNIFRAHLALLGANVIYGANYLIAKGVMPHKIGPSTFILIRVVIGGLLFWVVKQYIREKVHKRDLFRLAACGFLGVAANQLFFFHGLNLTSPIDASIIITSVPVMVMIFSFFILKEKFTSNKLLGLLIGGIGAVFLVWYGKNSEGTSSLLGNLFVFLNTCSYALYLIFVKPLMKKYKPITVISWVFLFGLVFVLPIGIRSLISTDFSSFDLNTYLAIGYVVLFTTFLAYLFNIYGLSHVSPTITSSYTYVQPVVSFILVSFYAYLFVQSEYAKDITSLKIVSCILVVIGVYLISKPEKISTQS